MKIDEDVLKVLNESSNSLEYAYNCYAKYVELQNKLKWLRDDRKLAGNTVATAIQQGTNIDKAKQDKDQLMTDTNPEIAKLTKSIEDARNELQLAKKAVNDEVKGNTLYVSNMFIQTALPVLEIAIKEAIALFNKKLQGRVQLSTYVTKDNVPQLADNFETVEEVSGFNGYNIFVRIPVLPPALTDKTFIYNDLALSKNGINRLKDLGYKVIKQQSLAKDSGKHVEYAITLNK